MVRSLDFAFCLIIPSHEAEDGSNPEMPTGTDKERLNKHLLSLTKGPGNGQPGKTKFLDNN
jgi:hypothetical protein